MATDAPRVQAMSMVLMARASIAELRDLLLQAFVRSSALLTAPARTEVSGVASRQRIRRERAVGPFSHLGGEFVVGQRSKCSATMRRPAVDPRGRSSLCMTAM